MKDLFSPGSLLTVAGAVLTVIGSVAYATDSPNVSLPTIFYGIPIFLGGLALKSSELPPPVRMTPAAQFSELRDSTGTKEQLKLLKDVVRQLLHMMDQRMRLILLMMRQTQLL